MKTTNEILEEFDKEFSSQDGQDYFDTQRISTVKNFLRTALNKRTEEMVKKLKEMKLPTEVNEVGVSTFAKHYNLAIDDILSTLKEEKI